MMQSAKAIQNQAQGHAGKDLSAGYFKPDAIRKHSEEILVLDTCIAGFWIHCPKEAPETDAILERLTPGTQVKLYRDPDNIHDKWAIAVYIEAENPDDPEIEVGFLPRYKNQTVSRLMDLGRQFNAYIAEPIKYPENSDEFRRNYSPTEYGDQPPLEIYMVE